MSDSVPPICPKCHSRRTARVKRTGFFQTVVLPYFDRYPWECTGCRSVFSFKSRGRLKSRKHPSPDSVPAATMDTAAQPRWSTTAAD